MITFPDDPFNGQEVVDPQVDGSVIIWTYNEKNNEWGYQQYGEQGAIRIFTDQVMVRDNTEPPETGLSTPPSQLMTQKDVNFWQAEQDKQLVQLSSRVADAVDFSQNTIGKGFWTHQLPPEAELYPRPGEFFTGNNEIDFGQITEFKFNDTGVPGSNNPGSLEGTRVGDYLLVQCNGTNDFGYYVITGLETENVANQLIRTLTVQTFRDTRFKGVSLENVRHTVSTLRPVYTIVQDEQPVVSTRGVFWYREVDDHLFISNYGDGFTGEGPQWTDLTAELDGKYLPLTGGTIDGQVIINKGPLLVNGAQVVELPTGGDLFTVLNSDNGDAILAINGAGSGKYLGKQTVDENIATLGYCNDNYLKLKGGTMTGDLVMNGHKITGLGDATQGANAVSRNYGDGRYLQLKAGGTIDAEVKFTEDNRLEMGGTYNNNIIDGKQDYTSNSLVPTLGYVNHQIRENLSIGSLSPRDKMYLQGFYPWKVGEGSQISNPGEFLAKKSDYNVDLDPANWRYLYFSVFDAYGQDLAGTFMNHMDMDKQRELVVWIARENGAKICALMGKMKCRDQNFEERFNIDIDASDKDLVISKNYDQASLRIDKGEILWIKCSAWGN